MQCPFCPSTVGELNATFSAVLLIIKCPFKSGFATVSLNKDERTAGDPSPPNISSNEGNAIMVQACSSKNGPNSIILPFSGSFFPELCCSKANLLNLRLNCSGHCVGIVFALYTYVAKSRRGKCR